jgi:hypothetical protein
MTALQRLPARPQLELPRVAREVRRGGGEDAANSYQGAAEEKGLRSAPFWAAGLAKVAKPLQIEISSGPAIASLSG